MHNFLKRNALPRLQWSRMNYYHLHVASTTYSLVAMELNHNLSQFGHEPAEGQLTHLNNCSRFHRDNRGKIMLAKLQKLWKHHAAYLKDVHYRKDKFKPCKPRNNIKFEIGQTVMVKIHACHTLKPKYLMDYRVLKIIESTLLLNT